MTNRARRWGVCGFAFAWFSTLAVRRTLHHAQARTCRPLSHCRAPRSQCLLKKTMIASWKSTSQRSRPTCSDKPATTWCLPRRLGCVGKLAVPTGMREDSCLRQLSSELRAPTLILIEARPESGPRRLRISATARTTHVYAHRIERLDPETVNGNRANRCGGAASIHHPTRPP